MNKRRVSSLTSWIISTGLFFLLMMTLLRGVIFLRFNSQHASISEVLNSFTLGLRFDLRTIAVLMLIMLVIGLIPFFRPFKSNSRRRGWLIFLGIISFLFLFIYVADFAHYSYLAQRLNASVLNYLEDAAISLNMVWESYPVIWILLGIFAVTFLFWWVLKSIYKRFERKPVEVSARQRVLESIISIAIIGLMIFGSLSQYPLRWSDAFGLGTDYKANLALNPFESFLNTLQFRKNTYSEQRLKELYPVLDQYYHFDDTTTGISFSRSISFDSTGHTKPNVVLIIAESFSAYKSSFYGNPLNTTPFFDSLSRNGILFSRCFTPAYGTARGVWATLTGFPDVEAPATASRNPAAVDQHMIINDFTGYEKFFFLGGSTSWANIRGVLTNNIEGLNLYEQDSFDAPKIDVWGISDKNLFLEANKVLATQSGPFFAIIQTADNHRPYTIPEEDLDEFRKITVSMDSLRKNSFESLEEFNAFRYTDFCFRKFMTAASRESYFDNTIFVIIGDHGIPGNANALFPKVWTEQRLTQQHVPLLYYAPKLFGAQTNERVASQIDVLPTLAGLCKQSYVNTTLGRDLLDGEIQKDFAFTFDLDNRQIGLIDSQYFFRKMINTDKTELFSMTSNENINPASKPSPEIKKRELLTEALYEASKYLLLNNKKEYAKKLKQPDFSDKRH